MTKKTRRRCLKKGISLVAMLIGAGTLGLGLIGSAYGMGRSKPPALSMKTAQTLQTNYTVSFLLSHVDSATVKFDDHDQFSYCTRTDRRNIWCTSFYHGCDASGDFTFHSIRYYTLRRNIVEIWEPLVATGIPEFFRYPETC